MKSIEYGLRVGFRLHPRTDAQISQIYDNVNALTIAHFGRSDQSDLPARTVPHWLPVVESILLYLTVACAVVAKCGSQATKSRSANLNEPVEQQQHLQVHIASEETTLGLRQRPHSLAWWHH